MTYQIGAWYFPGGKDNAGYPAAYAKPWDRFNNATNGGIGDFTDRIPLKGAYAEGDQAITDRQILEMAAYGLNFVGVDSYWESDAHAAAAGRSPGPRMNHWIESYRTSQYKNALNLCILACNNS